MKWLLVIAPLMAGAQPVTLTFDNEPICRAVELAFNHAVTAEQIGIQIRLVATTGWGPGDSVARCKAQQ